jgi:TolB protein
LLDIKSRDLTVLTQNKLDESPYFSPNGGMIIFSTNRNNKGVLSVISLYNDQIVELAQKDGEVREPSWSNYSKQ